MKWWKVIANMAIPALQLAGEAKKAEDDNDTGKDDAIGVTLVFVGELLNALINGKPLPSIPDALRDNQGKVLKA